MVSVLRGQEAGDVNQKQIVSVQRLEKVEEAVRGFMAANGRRPCPADGSYASNTANFGVEAATPGTCTVTSGMMGPDTTGNLVAGVIPTKTLGLSDDYAFDAFGRRISYVVDKRATLAGSGAGHCNTLQNFPANTGTGGITIESSTGGTVLDNVMAAYIIHGPTGFGAFPAQGSTVAGRLNTGATDTDMLTDAAVNSSFTYTPGAGGTFTNVLVRKSRTPTFDQLVWYRPDLKNRCCVGSVCGTDSNCTLSANQGGGTLTSGNTRTEYASGSDPSCTANTLTCTNGTLSCSTGNMNDCQYASCTQACTLSANQGGGTLASGSSINAYPTNAVTPPDTCSQHMLSCTAGTLACDGNADLTSCAYNSCTQVPPGCIATWGLAMSSGQSINAYATASDLSCTQHTLNCSWGALSCDGNADLTNCQVGSCSLACTLSANQGGGTLASGGTATEYKASSGASCPAETMTCTNGTLSCSSGTMSTDCQYSSCTVSGGGGGGNGNVWVADTGNNRVQEFDSSGNYLSQFGSGQLNNPQGIAIDASGNLWVVDSSNGRVVEFDSSGNYLSQFGAWGSSDGYFQWPSGIAIDAGGNLWVVDTYNNRVQEFDSSGNYLSQFGNGQLSNPQGIGIDSGGNFWVTDTGNNRVQEFDSNGNYLSQFGSYGTSNGQFNAPEGGIAIK
jgi:hypothetical protein